MAEVYRDARGPIEASRSGQHEGVLNALTVDVEEHFQVSAFENTVRREDWERLPSRVEQNTNRLLDLFDESEVSATFFVLGWIAERKPHIVRAIADRGHEIASHGQSHRLVHEQDPGDFLAETRHSRQVLQQASGQAVDGYRAASFSIGPRNPWALDALVEAGFRYDSSLFPVRHDRYGAPRAPRRIHRLGTPAGGSLIEVPPTTLALPGGANLAVAGGGYLRLYPAAFSHWVIRRLNRHEGMPAVIYVHPWEVDPDQPRIRAGLRSRLRHYVGLKGTAAKLRGLTRAHRFGPIGQLLAGAEALPLVSWKETIG